MITLRFSIAVSMVLGMLVGGALGLLGIKLGTFGAGGGLACAMLGGLLGGGTAIYSIIRRNQRR